MTDIIANLGPVDGSHILLIPDTMSQDAAAALLAGLLEQAKERGVTGPAAMTLPLVVVVPDGATIQDVGPTALARLGWYQDVPTDLLKSLVDDEPCSLDHHGGCQSHGYLSLDDGEVCPQTSLKRIIAARRMVEHEIAAEDAEL